MNIEQLSNAAETFYLFFSRQAMRKKIASLAYENTQLRKNLEYKDKIINLEHENVSKLTLEIDRLSNNQKDNFALMNTCQQAIAILKTVAQSTNSMYCRKAAKDWLKTHTGEVL